MKFHFIRMVALCLIACLFLAASGCEDADAKTRLNVANAIKKAADDAFLAGSDSASLGKVERDLKAIKNGSDKQMATRDRLLASVQMHLATLDMNDIEKIEIALRHDLVRLRAMGFASERLAAFSAAREKVSGPINTPQLNERREQIRSQAEQLRNQASQIEAPVVNSVETLQKSNEDVMRLQRQANRLRDEAAMADPVNRFPIMEQAIDLERQADRIEAEMMRQELSLELVQQPAKEMMDRSRNDLEEMLAEIDAAQDDLQTISRQMSESGAKGRVALQEMDAKITQLSKAMSDRISNELQQAYQKAESTLQSAASNARKGGRKSEGRLAKQASSGLLAQIQLEQADLGLMQVRGMDEWIRILTMLSMNDDLGNRDAWKLQAEEAIKRRDVIAKKTVGFIDESLESGAKSDLIEDTRAHLEVAKAFLNGDDLDSIKPVAARLANPSTSSNSSSDDGEVDYSKPNAMPNAIRMAFLNDEPVLVWNGLPSSWRDQINGLVHDFGSKIDANAYDELMRTARTVVDILAKKKTFIMNSQMGQMMMQQAAGAQSAEISENYDLLVTVLQTFVDSDLGTAEGLKRCDLGKIISKYGSEIVRLSKAISMSSVPVPGADDMPIEPLRALIAGAEGMTSVVNNVSGDEATITVSMPDTPDEITQMKKVDDRWVPVDMADQMPMVMMQAKGALAGQNMAQMNASLKQAQAMLPMIKAVVTPLQQASTQKEFDEALMTAMQGMMQ